MVRATMSVTGNSGQITKSDLKKLATIIQSIPKTLNWIAIERILRCYNPNKNGAPNLDGLLRQALHRACVHKSGQRFVTLVLKKLTNLSLSERVRFACTAVQCENIAALQAIICDDSSVLYFSSDANNENDEENDDKTTGGGRGATLLHLACERYGWNKEIKFILEEILKHNDNGRIESSKSYIHKGMFHETKDAKMPLTLAWNAGSELDQMIDFLRNKHPAYLRANLCYVSKIMAECGHDTELLVDLIRWYDGKLLDSFHPADGSSPLHHACYFQNDPMVWVLLMEYMDYYQYDEVGSDANFCLLSVQKRLLSLNNEGLSPLGHLILSVGDPDAENAWGCIDSCVNFFANFYRYYHESYYERTVVPKTQQAQFSILHLFLAHTWDHLLMKKNWMKILDRVVQRLEIDICSIDKTTGNTLLSIVIDKIAIESTANDRKKTRELSLQILDYFLHPPSMDSFLPDRRPAATRDGSDRLPLHLACDRSLRWKMGLESIVSANMSALESYDPSSSLPPFALCAIGPKSELDSVYTLLRLHPGSIDSVLSR